MYLSGQFCHLKSKIQNPKSKEEWRREGFIIFVRIVIHELRAATKETGFFINYRAGTYYFREKTRFLDTRA